MSMVDVYNFLKENGVDVENLMGHYNRATKVLGKKFTREQYENWEETRNMLATVCQ